MQYIPKQKHFDFVNHLIEKYTEIYRKHEQTIKSQYTLEEFIDFCFDWESTTFIFRNLKKTP